MNAKLTDLEWKILDAVAYDAENLEQIYQALCFEPLDAVARRILVRGPGVPVLLSDIADAIRSLVERRLLVARHDPGEPLSPDDLSYVWRSWFEPTSEGRGFWAAGQPTETCGR